MPAVVEPDGDGLALEVEAGDGAAGAVEQPAGVVVGGDQDLLADPVTPVPPVTKLEMQFVPDRVKTSTAPALRAEVSAWLPLMPVAALVSKGAPTASVVPSDESATPNPNLSPPRVFDALMYACWAHAPPDRVKT